MLSLLKKSLELKIIVATGLILASLFGFYFVVELWFSSKGTYGIVFNDLESLANVIQKSLVKDMRSGKGADVQEILEIVGTEKRIETVAIFDDNGLILKSAERMEIGMPVPQEVLEAYRSGKIEFISERDDGKVFHVIQPIANAPPCFGCHSRDSEVNGVLYLGYSLKPVQSYILNHSILMLALFFATISVIGLSIYALLKKTVSGPLREMQGAMSRAEKGDLGISIPVSSDDEIGGLQVSFNRMVSRIKELLKKNLEQQKDIFEKEQELKMRETLADKNRAIEDAYKEIVDKNRYYMEMLSFISHELKNPLVVLKGYSTLMLREELGELTDGQHDAVVAMERNVDALQEMIANYLDLSRIERGEMKLDLREVDVGEEIIKPLLAQFSETLSKASMSIRVEGLSRPLKITADPMLVKAGLGNLVSNAIKYGWPDTDILIELEVSADYVRFSVFNEGYGIPFDQLEKVFVRFTRLQNDVTRAQKGSGLGLCIVREIANMHGGRAWAESKEGEWARVAFSLPNKQAEG